MPETKIISNKTADFKSETEDLGYYGACVFRFLLKSNSDRATIIAKKTATTAINALKGTENELLDELDVDGVDVGIVVGFDDEDGVGVKVEDGGVWVGLRGMFAGMFTVWVMLQSLVSPANIHPEEIGGLECPQ